MCCGHDSGLCMSAIQELSGMQEGKAPGDMREVGTAARCQHIADTAQPLDATAMGLHNNKQVQAVQAHLGSPKAGFAAQRMGAASGLAQRRQTWPPDASAANAGMQHTLPAYLAWCRCSKHRLVDF